MKYFKAVYKIINFSHETFHEDDFAEANAQVFKFSWERLHFREIVKLHCSWEIEKHMSQIRAFAS